MSGCGWYGHISPHITFHTQNTSPLFVLASVSLDMESAIKTLVTTFLSSSKGKENLDSKSFQKLISSQFGSMMEVSLYIPFVLSKYPSVSESFFFFFKSFIFYFFRKQMTPLPLRRCSGDWMRTATERSASRNTSLWLATWPTPSVSARVDPVQMHHRGVWSCSVWGICRSSTFSLSFSAPFAPLLSLPNVPEQDA